jgi:Aspartyl protease
MKLLKTFLFLTILFASNNLFSQDFQSFLTKGSIEPKEFTITFPFELYNNWIVIKTTINGVEGDFILDTGCSVIALDEKFAVKCKMKLQTDLAIKGNGGSKEQIAMKNFDIDSLHFGGITFKGFGGATFDAQFISEKDKPIAGLIGASLINKMNWKFDFDSSKITVSSHKFEQEGIKIYYWTGNENIHRTNLNINGSTQTVLIDLGSGNELSADLNDAKVIAKGLKMQKQSYADAGSAGVSNDITKFETVNDYDLSYSLGNDTNTFDFKPIMKFEASHSGLILGTGYLKYFNFVINSSQKHYILKRNQIKRDTNLYKDYPIRLGLEEKKVVITRLRSDKFVEANNVKLKDEITELGDKPIEDFKDWAEIKAFLNDKMDKKLPYNIKIKGQKKAIEIRESVCDNLVEME